MKCIVLAAGYATRLYPLTENFPKPLLKVGPKSILDWLVDDAAPIDGTETNETRLGAVKDIQFAVEKLGIREDCAVMAGDNVLDFSIQDFFCFAQQAGTSCVMCHEENRLEALRKTAVIKFDSDHLIISYEEKPQEPKGNHAVPPFYFYLAKDLERIPEALENGCNYDAPGNFAAWLSKHSPMHAYVMPGKRYDIGDMKSYQDVHEIFGEQNNLKR